MHRGPAACLRPRVRGRAASWQPSCSASPSSSCALNPVVPLRGLFEAFLVASNGQCICPHFRGFGEVKAQPWYLGALLSFFAPLAFRGSDGAEWQRAKHLPVFSFTGAVAGEEPAGQVAEPSVLTAVSQTASWAHQKNASDLSSRGSPRHLQGWSFTPHQGCSSSKEHGKLGT